MNTWFKTVVSLFLFGILYLGWEYVKSRKEIALNGRYASAPSSYGYLIIDSRTGNSYDANGQLMETFKIKK